MPMRPVGASRSFAGKTGRAGPGCGPRSAATRSASISTLRAAPRRRTSCSPEPCRRRAPLRHRGRTAGDGRFRLAQIRVGKNHGIGHARRFRHNAVRLQLHALAYNLGNFMRTLALPEAVDQWSLTTLREKLVKIGAKIVRSGCYVAFQMAEVAIPRELFADILRRIDRLRPKPGPA